MVRSTTGIRYMNAAFHCRATVRSRLCRPCESVCRDRRCVPQLLLAERKLNEAAPLLQQGGPLIDAWQDNHQQKEYLKVGRWP